MLLSMKDISKSFDGTPVLESVNLDLNEGEVHLLAGENGAGKSTLIKILGGVYDDYDGSILFDGREARFASPNAAATAGISVIHQELSLIPSLSVVDNLFLGREETRFPGRVDQRRQRHKAQRILNSLELHDVELEQPIAHYSVSLRQMLEIAKALVLEARILVMDEPTSALNEPEVRRLFGLIEELKQTGCGIIYITHKMEEVYRIADRITVLRDGKRVGCETADRLPRDELLRWMVGRELSHQFPRRTSSPGGECLRLDGFTVPDPDPTRPPMVNGVSLVLRKGEVLGLAGLRGAGNSDLLQALFSGANACGKVWLNREEVIIQSPQHAIHHGMALLTNDRASSGIIAGMSVASNLTLAALPFFSRYGWLDPDREQAAARSQISSLRIRVSSEQQDVAQLSGGNQQKVLLAKWLQTEPSILLLDEPTRGVDVGAKHEIYEWMSRWTSEGMGILWITSEMPELLALSDRILVMHRGRANAEFSQQTASPEKILQAAMGEPD